MSRNQPIAVTSASFCRHPILRSNILAKYENVRFNDKGRPLNHDELHQILSGCERAITALDVIDERLVSKLPKLKVISKFGVGVDMLNFADMKKAGVLLGWEGGLNRRSVAELTLAFMITMLRRVPAANLLMRDGGWQVFSGPQLSQKTIGIIGCGFVGQDLVRLLQPFNCRILVHDIRTYNEFYQQYNIAPVGLDDLLRQSDVVTLHTPLDSTTRNLINHQRLALMKASAVLVNCARGGIVDEAALKQRLRDGLLFGAAFDVFAVEPVLEPELLNLSNFFSTPHIGGSSQEAILAMGNSAINGLEQAKPIDYYFANGLLPHHLIGGN